MRRLGAGRRGETGRAWGRIVAGSLVLAVFLGVAGRLWPPPVGRTLEAAWLGAMILGAVGIYAAMHATLGSEEARLAWTILRRRRAGNLH